MKHDLAIIGTGTAAMVAATRVQNAGWNVAVIDEKPYGGTCALRGCDPKKMLIDGAEVIDGSPSALRIRLPELPPLLQKASLGRAKPGAALAS